MKPNLLPQLSVALSSVRPRVGTVSEEGKSLNASPLLSVLTASHGDYGLTVAYAGLFSPDIRMRNGIPFGRFSPDDNSLGVALDRFHLELLHHSTAENRNDQNVLRAIGLALSFFWSRQLSDVGIPGRFEYDEIDGNDVIYVPPKER